MDTLRLAFGFVMFHRRIIIGLVLLVGLYYFINEVVPKIAAARREAAFKQPNPASILNKTNSENKAAPEKPKETKQPDETSNSSDGGKPVDQFLKSENADDLIQELIRLKDLSHSTSNDAMNLVVAADIIKISKRLLELPIDSNQRKFALGSLTESLLLMRLIKINSNLANDSIDVEFLTKTKELLQDQDPIISSYAAVTILTSAIFEYQSDPSDDRIAPLEKLVDDHLDQIAVKPDQLSRITGVLLKSKLSDTDSTPKAKALLNRVFEHLARHENPEVNEVARAFREDLLFRKLDVDNLVFYLGDRSAASDLKADAFFEALQEFPEASIPVFQTSMNVIGTYMEQNKLDRAEALMTRMEKEILPKRKDAASRERIRLALEELQTKLELIKENSN